MVSRKFFLIRTIASLALEFTAWLMLSGEKEGLNGSLNIPDLYYDNDYFHNSRQDALRLSTQRCPAIAMHTLSGNRHFIIRNISFIRHFIIARRTNVLFHSAVIIAFPA